MQDRINKIAGIIMSKKFDWYFDVEINEWGKSFIEFETFFSPENKLSNHEEVLEKAKNNCIKKAIKVQNLFTKNKNYEFKNFELDKKNFDFTSNNGEGNCAVIMKFYFEIIIPEKYYDDESYDEMDYIKDLQDWIETEIGKF